MSISTYCRREWLNPEWSSYTGSVVGWVGIHGYENVETMEAILEVADCQQKVRLHGSLMTETECRAFAMKARRLAEVATELATFVEHIADVRAGGLLDP